MARRAHESVTASVLTQSAFGQIVRPATVGRSAGMTVSHDGHVVGVNVPDSVSINWLCQYIDGHDIQLADVGPPDSGFGILFWTEAANVNASASPSSGDDKSRAFMDSLDSKTTRSRLS